MMQATEAPQMASPTKRLNTDVSGESGMCA